MGSKTRIALISLMAVLLTSCATIGADSFCAVARPIYTDRCKDELTDATARQVNDHDDVGAKLCGWKKHTGAPCQNTTTPH